MTNVLEFRRAPPPPRPHPLDRCEIPVPLPASMPVTAPGWSVRVVAPGPSTALSYPCAGHPNGSGGCVLPALSETALVVAALKEALAALGHPVVEVAGEGRADG